MKARFSPFVWLLAALASALAGILATFFLRIAVPAPNAALKQEAAARMQACMDAVKRYKASEGLPLSEEDWFETGLLGSRLTGLTTTLGVPEAKRTTANSDMAALVVELLQEAGVQPGDSVAAGFSGSFPALDLAVLAACDAMQADCRYIASIGSSSYGANQPELSFPEIACRLADEGLVSRYPLAVSAGGQLDLGLDMDEAALASVWQQLSAWPIPRITEADYPANLRLRMQLYEQNGPLSCFIAVGGGLVTSGRADVQLGQGLIPPDRVGPITDKSGLLERYSALGLPVIELLNIKQLAASYGLAYDPQALPPPGSSALYTAQTAPKLPALVGLAGCLCCLALFARARRQRKEAS